MNQQKVHPVSVHFPFPIPEEVEQGGAVAGEPNDEHDGVGCDGDNLSISKLHVIRKTYVCIVLNLV